MAGYSKEKFEATQQQAMDLVQFLGVGRIDELPRERGNKVFAALCHLLEALAEVSPDTGRRHIAKAMRRQRHPDWKAKNESGWGGKREGAGRKIGGGSE